ncbi:hypothetical protein McpSp1_04290 [Methanocorpusculaceae archaeon Sp1]|nr:hypothetical protein [Methanocorpusculaceae archaeon Sp1]
MLSDIDVCMDWEQFKIMLNGLPTRYKEILKLDIGDDKILYGYDEYRSEFTQYDFNDKINHDLKFNSENMCISGDGYYEILVDPKTPSMRIMNEYKNTSITDTELKITYSFQRPSFQFLVNLLIECNKHFPNMHGTMVPPPVLRYEIEHGILLPFEQLLSRLSRFSHSIVLKNDAKINDEERQVLIDALIFNVSCNTGLVFKKIDCLSDIFSGKMRKKFRVLDNFQNISPPKRKYIKALTAQYYMGVSSADPFIEFLCYYHVMEHFFDEVYKEDIIKTVQDEITSPKFSTRRQKDIVKLIETIQNKVKSNKLGYAFSEQEALSLVIKKYIPSLQKLKNDVDDEDNWLIQYYLSHQVSFSGGDKIDLASFSNDDLYTNIAARIYKTRNSIVHSKSNDFQAKERGIYVPFKNEMELSHEIPLMRIIAESIIINSSTQIK